VLSHPSMRPARADALALAAVAQILGCPPLTESSQDA
jgi:hypothetical protein